MSSVAFLSTTVSCCSCIVDFYLKTDIWVVMKCVCGYLFGGGFVFKWVGVLTISFDRIEPLHSW